MKPVDVTKETINDFVSAEGISVLDFWASWCGPCRAFAPVFDRMAAKYPDIRWGKINTEEEQELAAQFQIRSIPTLMIFRDGIMLMNQAGAAPETALDDVIRQAQELDMDKVRAEVEAEIAKAEAAKK